MTIDELKRALVEVKKICENTNLCVDCPFYERRDQGCRLCYVHNLDVKAPNIWDVDDWKEDANDTTTACADVQP